MRSLSLLLVSSFAALCASAQPAEGSLQFPKVNNKGTLTASYMPPPVPGSVFGMDGSGALKAFPLGEGISIVGGALVISDTGGDWADITNTPTTLAGYGITDPVALTSGSYSNPAWIASLAWSKLSGTPTTLAGYGITDGITAAAANAAYAVISHTHTFSSLTSKPTTLAGYGITDGITAAAANAAYQPLNETLADLSGLTTDAWGRGLLGLTGGEALRTYGEFGDLAALSAVDSSNITNGSVVNADISDSAAISVSKIAGLQASLDGKRDKAASVIGSTGDLVAGATYIVRGNATYTRTLPATPADGDTIVLVQSGDTWTGTVTIGRNGSSINGAAADVSYGAPAGLYSGALLLTYHSASGGWITHSLPNATSLSSVYAASGHTHSISAISGTNTNRFFVTGGTFATGQEGTAQAPLDLTAGVLKLTNGDRGDITVSGTGGTWSIDSGAVTDAMLAGSISNAKLANSSISIAGASASLGGSVSAATIFNATKEAQALLSLPGMEIDCGDWWGSVTSGTGGSGMSTYHGRIYTGSTASSVSCKYGPQYTSVAWNCFGDASHDIDWDKKFIISTWVWIDAHSTNGQFWWKIGKLQGGGGDLGLRGFGLRVNDLTLTAQSYDSGLNATSTMANLTASARHHLALMNNANGTAAVYVDGVNVGTLTGVPTGKESSTFWSYEVRNNSDSENTQVVFGHFKFVPLE